MSRSALVLGATGLIGSRCVEHLLACGQYADVACLVRRPSRTARERLRERVVDFDKLRSADVEGATDLFCAIGSTMKKAGSREAFRRVDHDIPLSVARLGVTTGITRIALVSSAGADANARTFYLTTKGQIEDALGALPLQAFHVLRPSILLGDREESRPGEAIGIGVARATQSLLLGPLRRWRPIDADVVARAMVAAMLGADPSPARHVYEYDAIVRLAAR